MPRSVGWFCAALLGVAMPVVLPAQSRVAERQFEKPDAEFPESFDQIGALRQLPSGQILVVDLGPKALLMADFRTGRQAAIGRNGQGPGEYQFPGELIAYRGDSTLLVDRVTRRFLTVSADGQLGKTVPFPDGLAGLAQPKGADRMGRIYFQASPFGGPGDDDGPLVIPDSAPVVRWDRANNRLDTLTRVKIPATNVQRSGTANSRIVLMRPQPYAPQDEWSVGADGRLAVARVGDYHVEWLGDRPARGAPVLYDRVRIDGGDRKDFLAGMKNTRNRITVTTGGPGRSQEVKPPEVKAEDFEWPEYKPPFRGRSAMLSPEGQLWLQRYTPARDSIAVYDVFDTNGNLAARMRLPKGRQVVGIGPGTLYAVRTDSDGLQWLERYRR